MRTEEEEELDTMEENKEVQKKYYRTEDYKHIYFLDQDVLMIKHAVIMLCNPTGVQYGTNCGKAAGVVWKNLP